MHDRRLDSQTTAAVRRTRSAQLAPAKDIGTSVPSAASMSSDPFIDGNGDMSGSPDDFAALLGIGVQECDAARIIMAARVRLRLLRQSEPPMQVRSRVKQIMRARDVLLLSAVQATRRPAISPR